MLNIQQIVELIPHRYPFILVDRIIKLEENKRAVGIKNVSINEPFFSGHFPEHPVMPGVLIVEALAQVGGITMCKNEKLMGKIGLLVGIDNARFKRQVTPGDQLLLEFEVNRMKGEIVKGKGTATVNSELVCEAEISFAFVQKGGSK
ncbi:3-hydroxyacyl-[acyl-carrier-protein] dehydratase FabZ [Paenibacillus odorifer]|jgi:3-hydroxyacyl-[acyl-carrier-protein] dehydratase|uniref:3-hydroxyacyl-ACP dehydratase FabZ n=1 Tax=Paenibacillus TaxID=44249 RepID=UPI00096F7A2A|nr:MULTISPECIES: 3-hydroxyacyl-ACP dehydratase FabZ [Paenibacillus]MDH6427914.1 3-hydroxyacyl-[acyl-carrier-protein] dehydratase [Paenibacillus sp. PastH-4]MDH6444458.1 3-hydroxyacyl-[acyl-carrier-protein] dehydratase [Paenibacillus sp. PastF-4]MDH6528357.1 3-hydroxyacyl-[acyl-carrier-protein] dehydratase [Paenibacillus sp. PastH-3]OMD67971.1 3-hydroxyacyl-[acyl-carrier-protein] dehydratase FabZ [Paenibacillus odorifer]